MTVLTYETQAHTHTFMPSFSSYLNKAPTKINLLLVNSTGTWWLTLTMLHNFMIGTVYYTGNIVDILLINCNINEKKKQNKFHPSEKSNIDKNFQLYLKILQR